MNAEVAALIAALIVVIYNLRVGAAFLRYHVAREGGAAFALQAIAALNRRWR